MYLKNNYIIKLYNNIMSVIRKVLGLFKKYRMQLLFVIIAIAGSLLYGYFMGFFTSENFAISQLGRELVFFSMEGCPHCDDMKPIWELLKSNYGNNDYIELRQIVAQQSPEIVQKYSVQGFPTILALKNGELNMKYDGDRSYESLLQFMNLAMTN